MLTENERIELKLLLEAVCQKYGYDFRSYASPHIKRRVKAFLDLSGLESISAIQHKILNDIQFFDEFLSNLSINVTEMFRDPKFFLEIRAEIVPILKTYPFVKIWHPGCATGQEVFSMAIVLIEEGIYERSQIYATDFSEASLTKAKQGVYPASDIQLYTKNYQRSGGQTSFSDYYTAHYERVLFNEQLKEKVVFANHNLATDAAFGEMQMIVCRNVLIYFNRELQDKVLQLFFDSLCPGGILCLGSKESLHLSRFNNSFSHLCPKEKIYQKNYVL